MSERAKRRHHFGVIITGKRGAVSRAIGNPRPAALRGRSPSVTSFRDDVMLGVARRRLTVKHVPVGVGPATTPTGRAAICLNTDRGAVIGRN